jgi:hypothetical protein
MVDNWPCVGIAFCAEHDSYNDNLMFATPYVEYFVYMHVCMHTMHIHMYVLSVTKIIYAVCMSW